MASIQVSHLSKKFGEFTAVNDISISIDEGAVFGFLGHNGAGKTTTVKILTGQLGNYSGSVKILGLDLLTEHKEIQKNIGVLPEEQSLYGNLSVFQNIDFFRKLFGLHKVESEKIIERLGLSEKRDVKVSKLSKGLKQRTLLARSVLHKPKVLFLDEPTSGLDPKSALSILDLIREMKSLGITIFLTTHYLEEAESLCDEVAFLSKGRIIEKGRPSELMSNQGEAKIIVKFVKNDSISEKEFSIDDESVFRELEEIKRSFKIVSIETKKQSLRDIFIRLNESDEGSNS